LKDAVVWNLNNKQTGEDCSGIFKSFWWR
jgi:hypothetical protein